MRALLGLAALAASVNGQVVTLQGAGSGSMAAIPLFGQSAFTQINLSTANGVTIAPPGKINNGQFLNTDNWFITIPFSITSLTFVFITNTLTGQMQYRWSPNYPSPAVLHPGSGLQAASFTCDTCAGGTALTCNTATGPGTTPSPSAGWACSSLTRTYVFSNLVATSLVQSQLNFFSVQLFDINTTGATTTSFSFQVTRSPSPIVGDPQIMGMQGQDFQVHGVPDEIFNMITYPNLQVNARFVYLSAGACHDNFTACFAHPGTYISEEGIRLGKDKIHVVAGSFKNGLTVSVNGNKVSSRKTSVKLGSIELLSHRRVVITTPILSMTISNSDKFLNQETALFDEKLLSLGSERRQLLLGESFHPEVPLHGLQGQTWRNVEYPSGLEYEGSISDYHVTSNNLYGSDFVFNQYKH